MSIYETLSNIQVELKAPKNLYNSFGKYTQKTQKSTMKGKSKMLPKASSNMGLCSRLLWTKTTLL